MPVTFSSDMSKLLDGLERLHIALDLSGEERKALEVALSQVFLGKACLEVVDA
jgi:hypothetical protein